MCDMGLFGFSILFVNKDFGTYAFCFVGSPSINMANLFISLEGREGGGVL
jgi:hypothetical protein